MAHWTRWETMWFLLLALAVTVAYSIFGLTFLNVPWTPVALIGTAVAIPFCGVVSWVFHTMQRIGTVGENPFEGSANDVPISTIARGIEIDLRQLMDEQADSIPAQFPEEYNVQM